MEVPPRGRTVRVWVNFPEHGGTGPTITRYVPAAPYVCDSRRGSGPLKSCLFPSPYSTTNAHAPRPSTAIVTGLRTVAGEGANSTALIDPPVGTGGARGGCGPAAVPVFLAAPPAPVPLPPPPLGYGPRPGVP